MKPFEQYQLHEKANLLWKHGAHVATVKSRGRYLLLYSLDKVFKYQFAELAMGYQNTIDTIKIVPVQEMEKYLSSIELNDLKHLV
jgi:hypothetical protein